MKNTDERTSVTIELNNQLEIVQIDHDYKFQCSDKQAASVIGCCFYIEGKGYLAYENDNTPYTPRGGYDALKSILNDGGFLHYEGIKFINPIHERGVQRITCFD
ncbi:hypothetical protein CLV62_104102 [Dysgonomonas alginatilytica]|uniref:Uncharacterized protein n=1 Tax=Dysgonomonas alginatilytica TaxID=1605892 RepID=A0A2V3PTI5_9BACT|nr:hypothetical protein [Dysgonomonas alginatilytica]PXV66841.1 hypothetical protein CLV62_104102 [Dysgonomonas alginatilytica]